MAAIVLFCLALLVCIVLGTNILYALLAGLVIFALYGKKQGFSWKELGKMICSGVKTSASVLLVFPLIGILTAFWRACGTLPFIICCAVDLIRPEILLLMTFLLNCGVSMLTGTAFGTAATMGTICVSVGISMGMDPVLLGGAMLSGVYFGDRCSPASSSATLVAAATDTNLYDNLHMMHRTGWLPYLVSLAAYAALSVTHPLATVDSGVLDQLSGTFSLSWWTAIPALLILILPLCKVPIRPTMAVSALTALLVTVFAQGRALLPTLRDAVLGYLPAPGALHDVLSGGGMMSMVSATIMAVSAGLYAGLLGGMGVLNGAAHLAQRLARRAGRFPACAAISVVCSMVFCNQSTCAVVCNQLLEDDYTKRGHGRGEMALDIENSGIVLSPLIPWNISVSIPLAMLGADISAIPYEILLYAIPLCYWLTKRRVYPPKGDDCYDTIAEPLAHS